MNTVCLAALSRVLVIAISILSDNLISDHNATGVEQYDVTFSSKWSQLLLTPFLKWDSIHYVKLASKGYTSEHQLVFLPLYPSVMRIMVGWSSFIVSPATDEMLLIAGLLCNFASFCFCSYILDSMLLSLKVESTIVRKYCIYLYCFNPASVFFSAAYTESLFCALSWLGLYYCLNYRYISSCVPLFLASMLRSNGSLNVTVLLLISLQRHANLFVEATRSGSQRITIADIIKLFVDIFLRTVPAALSALVPGIAMDYFSHILVCGTNAYHDGSMNAITSNNAAGIVRADSDTVTTFCQFATTSTGVSSTWMYPYLQNKYWQVGFLQYYQWKQLPNFMLALPIWYYSARTVYSVYRTFIHNRAQSSSSNSKSSSTCSSSASGHRSRRDRTRDGNSNEEEDTIDDDTSNPAYQARKLTLSPVVTCLFDAMNTTKQMALTSPLFPFVVHLCVLLLVGMFWANVQISTRLICSSSPLIYIGMAEILALPQQGGQVKPAKEDVKKRSHNLLNEILEVSERTWLIAYVSLYFILGIVLHCNYYPWT